MDSRVSISSSRRRIKALCGYIASAEANGQFGRVFTQISRVLIDRDPYLNTDAGTMSPFEYGEVFVLDDGGEVYVCISGLNKLSLLNMEGCPVTAACLETVAALLVLLFLNLSRCNLTDDGCEKCSGLQNLKVLNVGFNKEHHFSLLQRETEKLRK